MNLKYFYEKALTTIASNKSKGIMIEGYVLGEEDIDNIHIETSVDEKFNRTYKKGLSELGVTWEDVVALATTIKTETDLVELRAERDKLIAETDYLALSDVGLTPEMTAYRQALRDITQQYSSLDDVVWPIKPV